MYFAALAIHSLLRWLSLALGILAVASAVAQGKAARRRVLPFAVSLDLQLVVGLALYLFLSPIVGPGSGAGPGYWSLGHPALALLALGLAHAGSVALRRTAGPRAPGAAALLALAFLALLAAVPWGRPLLRT